MSNLLHGPISTNQILPGEKRVNRDILAPQTYKTELIGFLVMNKLSIYGSLSIDLNFFCTYLPKNGLFLLIILASQSFYPNWPIFLHGYIRHICDIFQLCFIIITKSSKGPRWVGEQQGTWWSPWPVAESFWWWTWSGLWWWFYNCSTWGWKGLRWFRMVPLAPSDVLVMLFNLGGN